MVKKGFDIYYEREIIYKLLMVNKNRMCIIYERYHMGYLPAHQEKCCPETKYKGFPHKNSNVENLFLLNTYGGIPKPMNALFW